MSEQEQQAENQAEAPPQSAEGQVEQEQNQEAEANGEGKPEGWDQVELTPEQQARFNRIYGQMKTMEKTNKEVADEAAKLAGRLQELESKSEARETTSQLDTLRIQEREALDTGDIERAQDLRDQMTDLKIEVAQPKPKEEEKPKADKAEAFVNEYLTPDRMAKLESWVQETSDSGQVLRPWADQSHPDHKKAMRAAWAVISDPDMEGAEIDQILQEVDSVTGALVGKPVKAARPSAQVLSGDSEARPKGGKKVQLNEGQKSVAHAMFPNISASEAETRYAQAMEKY